MSDMDSLIGKQLGDYEIESILGSGGMARVYRGYDRKLNRHAAVKVIKVSPIDMDHDDTYRERFQREARAIARLHHPAVVSVYQFGASEDLYYMAMAFIEGQDLSQVLKQCHQKGTLLSYPQILRIIRDIAGALDYAHAQGVIHRDVKPSNIMVTEQGRAVLTDFGLALDSHEGTLGNAFGSVHYISPEQAVSSAQVTSQSDLYSLGIVLYEMLTGHVPFDDSSSMRTALMHITDTPPDMRQLNPAITPALEAVVMKVLSKEPEERYLTGAAFMVAVEQAIMQLGDTPPLMIMPAQPHDATTRILDPTDPNSSDTASPRSTSQLASSGHSRRLSQWLAAAGLLTLVLIVVAIGASAVFDGAAPSVSDDAGAAVALEVRTPEPLTVTAEPATLLPTEAFTATPARTLTATMASAALISPDALATQAPEQLSTAEWSTPLLRTGEEDEAEILLRYDGRTLLMFNRTYTRTLDISDLWFVRTNTEGVNTTFRAQEWQGPNIYMLRPADCMQVWTIRYRMLPVDEFPAEICQSRQAFRQTSRSFWVSAQAGAMFIVQRNEEVLAECPTVPAESLEEVRCLVSLQESAVPNVPASPRN